MKLPHLPHLHLVLIIAEHLVVQVIVVHLVHRVRVGHLVLTTADHLVPTTVADLPANLPRVPTTADPRQGQIRLDHLKVQTIVDRRHHHRRQVRTTADPEVQLIRQRALAHQSQVISSLWCWVLLNLERRLLAATTDSLI